MADPLLLSDAFGIVVGVVVAEGIGHGGCVAISQGGYAAGNDHKPMDARIRDKDPHRSA